MMTSPIETRDAEDGRKFAAESPFGTITARVLVDPHVIDADPTRASVMECLVFEVSNVLDAVGGIYLFGRVAIRSGVPSFEVFTDDDTVKKSIGNMKLGTLYAHRIPLDTSIVFEVDKIRLHVTELCRRLCRDHGDEVYGLARREVDRFDGRITEKQWELERGISDNEEAIERLEAELVRERQEMVDNQKRHAEGESFRERYAEFQRRLGGAEASSAPAP